MVYTSPALPSTMIDSASMEAFFLETALGTRFCVHHRPPLERKVGIVFVPPFAEELNKSRHVVSQAARRMASVGAGVLILDLHGTGDSSGDFGDARLEQWRQDMLLATRWMRTAGYSHVWLWGLRFGALLAMDVARAAELKIDRFVLWQPVIRGDVVVTQFLRLRAANALVTGRDNGESVSQLRQALKSGVAIEIAGYELAPPMADALDAIRLDRSTPIAPVSWFEVVAQADRPLSPASSDLVREWRELGVQVDVRLVTAEPFWVTTNSVELTQCPSLVDATIEEVRRLL